MNGTLRGFPDKIVFPVLFLSFADFVKNFANFYLFYRHVRKPPGQKPLALEELWPKGFERKSSACSQNLRIALGDLQVGASAPHQMRSAAPVLVAVPVGAVPGAVAVVAVVAVAGVPGAVAVAVAVARPPWVAVAAAVAAAVGWAVVAAFVAAAAAQCAAQSWLFPRLVPATVDAVSFVVAEAPPVAGAAQSPVDLRIPS